VVLGIVIGGGMSMRCWHGKTLFGRQKLKVSGETKIIFTSALACRISRFPRKIFYRKSDTIVLEARRVD